MDRGEAHPATPEAVSIYLPPQQHQGSTSPLPTKTNHLELTTNAMNLNRFCR